MAAHHKQHRFRVIDLKGASDTPGEAHFAITGPGLEDGNYARAEAIAAYLESALNAALKLFPPQST